MQNNNNNQQNGDTPTPYVSFETAWAGLKPELDKEAERRKKKRRFIIFWFFLLAIGLGLGSGWYLLNNSHNNIPDIANKTSSKNVTQSNTNGQTATFTKDENKQTNESVNNSKNKDRKVINATAKTFADNNNNQNNNNNKSKDIITETDNKTKETKSINNDIISKVKASNITHIRNITIEPNQKVVVSKNKVSNGKKTSFEKEALSTAKSSSAIIKKQRIDSKPLVVIDKAITKETTATETTKSINKSDTEVTNTITNNSTNNVNVIAELTNKIIDSSKHLTDTTTKQIASSKALFNKTSVLKGISYGIQFNIPFGAGVTYNDINGNNQPATILIPQVWVSKQLSKKHSVTLQFNPYAQYYTNKSAVLESNSYNIKINQGTRINNGPELINYSEITTFNKLFSIEATLLYNYQLTSALKLGMELSNNWVQGALIENKVTRNYTSVTKDSLYGIDKNSKEWSSLKSSFMLGNLELQYQIKKIAIGLDISTPLGNLFTDKINTGTLINKNIFIKWTIK